MHRQPWIWTRCVQSSVQSLTVRVSWTTTPQSLSYLIVILTRVQPAQRITMLKEEALSFWKVNVPQEQWPAECPDFLKDISEKDQRIIGMPNEEYTSLSWPEVRELVSTACNPTPAQALTAADRYRPRRQIPPQTVRAAAVQGVYISFGERVWQHYEFHCERAAAMGQHAAEGEAVRV